jgi:hypothetical protein
LWGLKKGKGENLLGRMMLDLAEELRSFRPDQAAFGPSAAAAAGESAGVTESKGGEPGDVEAIAGAAQDQVAAATNGIVQLQQGGAIGSGGSGGVYLFINPAMSGQVEQKSRRARQSGGGRSISWEGMSVSKEGDGDSGQEGGGEQMTTESGASMEVKVEKLDS